MGSAEEMYLSVTAPGAARRKSLWQRYVDIQEYTLDEGALQQLQACNF